MLNYLCKASAMVGVQNMCTTEPAGTELEKKFVEHLAVHSLSYGTSEEFKFRLGIFSDNDAVITAMNSDPLNTFELGHNKFSTWTKDEYSRILGEMPKVSEDDVKYHQPNSTKNVQDEDHFDWRRYGAVN